MDIGTAQAAEILGCTKATVGKWCRMGKLKTATQDGVGKPWHISEAEILELKKIYKGKGEKR